MWEADYDSWNRINTMTYPDGEVVTYNYDKGGNLFSVTTDKDGDKQTLVAEQRYDKYGNLIYRKMGNGTETTYAYDDKRLHLNSMSLASKGIKMMENVYKYDSVDNILSISNAAKPQGELGGTFSHSYVYDELNRLVNASGAAKGKNDDLLMCYDVMSNPLLKDSITYDYNTNNHANAVSRAGSRIFRYDANGNPISVDDTTANTLRVMQWDEEKRMQSLGDDGYVSRYTYNHAGDRVVKSHGGTTVAYVNGAPQGVLWHDADNWTMYVSPYMVVTAKRFTKHYYVGSQRIASKIGTGEFNNLYNASKACVTAGQKDYSERLKLITQSRSDYYAALGIPPGPPTAKGIYGEPEYSGAYGSYMITPLGNYDVPTGWPMKPYKRPYGGTPGPPVMYQKPTDPEDEGAGYAYSNAEKIKEIDIFFYHVDHLGSTSYITDAKCDVTQFICYKPYGEILVDEHAVSADMPWKFNGKEWDAETGLYYYGARYYEPSLSLWYGVDALVEKYASVGGYVYCVGNPVRVIDLDGRALRVANQESFSIILLSLPKEVRSSVILNEDNTIDKYSVSDALDKCPASGNLLALYKIVSDEREVSHFLN
ncbi:MAG: RHS repeat-associated core domain-containing protein [Bacteroidales bacterium]|nr:RHS repeat-associated core domain-containing protein [Bacteroidales bacterium]